MPVKIKCNFCEKVLVVPDAARGKAVKCPSCQNRLVIPAATEASAAKASPAKAVPAKASPSKVAAAKSKKEKDIEPVDSEDALAKLDFSRAEDKNARICIKCGYDMKYQDEEETECPQCGYDIEEGGLGVKARKKAMKGPDPADFYPGLFTQSWAFVGKNQKLALRTIIYTLVSLCFASGFAFLGLYLSMWPTRIFLALCFTISFLVIPGWMWFLDTEVIKLTLERKDKFKHLRFDFFLSSALGAAFVMWCVVFAGPMIVIPAILGYFFVDRVADPESTPIMLPICIVLGSIPSLWMLPAVMAHMTMPVQYKGWMVWKMVPLAWRNIKPMTVWVLFFLVTNIPNIAGVTAIAVFYGRDLSHIVVSMEHNADIARKIFDAKENPNTKKKGEAARAPVKLGDPVNVDFSPLIVPSVILVVMAVVNGFTSLFNMRTNGQFVYYNKATLDLVDKRKDYKYVAKEKVDEDEEKPKTVVQQLVEALVYEAIFALFGLIGGMLYGGLTDFGFLKGMLSGFLYGLILSFTPVYWQSLGACFRESFVWLLITIWTYPIGTIVFCLKNWEEHRGLLIRIVISNVFSFIALIALMVIQVMSQVNEFKMHPGFNPQQIQAPEDEDAVEAPKEGAAAVPGAAQPAQPEAAKQ